MLTVPEARAILLDAVRPLEVIETPLAEALLRTLAERVVADRDFPPTDRSAMDGFAVRAADLPEPGRTLRVRGELQAGRSASGTVVGEGEAVRIFTGASVPAGADAIVMVELCEEDRDGGRVTIHERPEPGQHVRRRGEDLHAGGTVLDAGTVLGTAQVAALAAVGRARVRVVRPPRVAVVSTGDEIVPVEAVPAPHQVRNSNAETLLAGLRELRIAGEHLGIAADEIGALDALLRRGLAYDVLLLTGGVSMGEYDLVGDALSRAGCEVLFHKVAMRPGKPILAARRGATMVLGLPGNPVSAFTGFHVFVAPALRKMMGDPAPVRPPLRATLVAPLRRKPGRLTYFLARLEWRGGEPFATPVRSASSGDVLSLARANAFIVADGDAHAIEAGAAVDVEALSV